MKGFKDSDGKFHPTEKKNGVRMKRDKTIVPEGMKLDSVRMQRGKSMHKIPDMDIGGSYWRMNTRNGKIENLHLNDPMGWTWYGNEKDINSFLIRISGSKAEKDFLDKAEENKLTLDMLKEQMISNLTGELKTHDDGLYELTGDNVVWKHGEIPEVDLHSELSGWDYFGDGKEFTAEEINMIENKFYEYFDDIGYDDFIKEVGTEWRKDLIETINKAHSFEDLFIELESEDFMYKKFEMYDELRRPRIDTAIHKAVKELQTQGKLRTK